MLRTQPCEVTSNNLCVSGVGKRADASLGDVLSLEGLDLLLEDYFWETEQPVSGEMGMIQKLSRTVRSHLHFLPGDSSSPALWMHCPPQMI